MIQHATPKVFTPATFVKGIIGTDDITTDSSRTHVAFIGRSNVGKSSLMNAVLGRKNLVKSSARAGKTTEINYFRVGSDYYFVDLPGYGFARLGAKQREKLRKLIVWYLLRTDIAKRAVCIVIDAQVGMTDFDHEVLTLVLEAGMSVCIACNKADRLNQSQRAKLGQSLDELGVDYFIVSARSLRGVLHIQDWIVSV